MNSDTRSPIGFLPAGWKLDSLKNITTKIGSGSTPRGGEAAYLEERIEYAFIRSQNVLDFQFSESEVKYISDSDANKLKNVHLQRDDLLLNITGDGITFGRCCIVPEEILPAAVNQHVSIIRLDQEKCLPGYLLAYLCLPQIKEYISNFNAGGSRRAITKGHIETFDIPLPPMSIQRSIQRFTFDVMHKVRANTQLNQNLEKIAQAIFKSWFVDFEPTKAKIAAREALQAEKPDATPEQISTAEQQAAIQAIAGAGDVIPTEQLQTIADLFPKQMVNSELGEIPEGWSAQPFGSQADILRGFSYKGKGLVNECSESVPMHNLNSILEGGGYKYSGLKHYSEEFKDKFRVEVGDLFVANTEQGHNHLLIGYGAMVPKHLAHGFFSHHLYRIRPNKAAVLSPEYISYLFKKGRFVRQVQGFTNGTTVNMLPIDGLKLPLCIVPNKQLVHCFSESVKPMHELIEKNTINNERLESMRDLLLPKLLSGELING
ncbi:hypothetical protein HGG63_07505 [Alteromonadaceae bacterium A_SAG1]|nr:hypothetical protein [Alteromonadaceae bacterium A_SAG1]